MLQHIWSKLNTEGVPEGNYVRLRVPGVSACAVYAAKRVKDDLEAIVLELPTSKLPANPDYPRTNGFHVEPLALAKGRSGRTRLLLKLTNLHYRDVFLTLARDVVDKLTDSQNAEEAVSVFVSRLHRWRSFLKRFGPDGLSPEEQRGLFGELYFLREHAVPLVGSDRAVVAWQGPNKEHQDFHFDRGHIEVKTTRAASPHAFHVANVRQLEPPSNGTLAVFFLVLDESGPSQTSLPAMVESIASGLSGQALDTFEELLLEVGYLDVHRSLYERTFYSVRSRRLFEVGNNFPRIREQDIPSGVEGVRFQVACAACTPYEASLSRLREFMVGVSV